MGVELFCDAMAKFASGVTIVATRDRDGSPWGFTATAFCSVSLDPQLILVCLDRNAGCYPVFMEVDSFSVNILTVDQKSLAKRFATKGIDKFAEGAFGDGFLAGCPVLRGALMTLECRLVDRIPAGDHVILLGAVRLATLNDGDPLVYYNRTFCRVVDL